MLNGFEFQRSDDLTLAQLYASIQKFYDEMLSYHEVLNAENKRHENEEGYVPTDLFPTENLIDLFRDMFSSILIDKGL